MKILITCDPELPVPPGRYGGVERLVSGLCQEYQRLGHEVYLIANPASTEPVKERFGWPASHSRGWSNVLKNGLKLRKVVRQVKPDVIHSFSRLMYLYPMFLTGIKIPVLQTYGRPISQKSTDLAKKICGKYIHFACCGRHMLRHLKGVDERWNVVYNFTDTDYFNGPEEQRDYLAFLGRIEDIKGTHEAILVAQNSGLPLVIAGNIAPEHQEYFDTQVKPFLNDKIRYIGPVDDAQKRELLSHAVAFLMPIKWEEPFGIVMIEAMACGAPVLAFNRGSVPEIVTLSTGYISEDVDTMSAQCHLLGKFHPQYLHEYVVKNFSRQKIAQDYISIFNKISDKHNF